MASNIVEILIGAKDDAKLDLDALRVRLDELAHKVAEAKVKVAGDKEAELALDRLGAKLITLGNRTAKPKITLEGAFKTAAEIGALDVALGHLEKKTSESSGGGLFSSMARGLSGLVSGLGGLAGAGSTLINPITIALAALAAIISGPLLASLAPITLGFAAFGAVAVHEITKIIAAHQKLQAAQQAYAKATTASGQASALKAERVALEGLSGPEKQVMGLMTQLGNEFHKLSKAVEPQVVKAFGSALKIVKDVMPALIPLAVAAGKAVAGFLNHIDSWLKSGSGKKFLHWLETDGPHAIETFGRVMWVVAQAVGRTFDFLRNAGDKWWQNFHATVSHVMHAWDDTVHAFQAAYHAIASVFDSIKSVVGGAVDWIVGKIHTLTGALSSINGALGGIPGKVLGALGLASGGIAGAASGGVRSNLTLVGEHGPELVQLSAGSRVYNNSQTKGMLAGSGGGGGPVIIQILGSRGGSSLDAALVNWIQDHVRTAGGGDVQVAFGSS